MEAEALEAVFMGAHDAVVAVVEMAFKRQTTDPPAFVERIEVASGFEYAPNFGRNGKFGSGLLAQEMTQAMFALAVAVKGGGVEIANARLPGIVECFLGLLFGNVFEKIA